MPSLKIGALCDNGRRSDIYAAARLNSTFLTFFGRSAQAVASTRDAPGRAAMYLRTRRSSLLALSTATEERGTLALAGRARAS